ncbi:hypothetical protein BB561_005226 [Smittium simulii]|uniref:FANCI solenoid 4 domain-containing protein n=1 Tax=Smittium simulii TaxID=133385 RepID=A0A2T9YBG4_9FUNG|nr:hypothetical protein BB561_005226 [Smittium simulii]
MLNSTLQFDQTEIEAEVEANQMDDKDLEKNYSNTNDKESQQCTGKGKKQKMSTSANKKKSLNILSKASSRLKKEAKLVPQLIYLMERCEHYAIILGNRAKVSLIHLFKRNVSRDFKINMSIEKTDNPTNLIQNEEKVEPESNNCEIEENYDSMLESEKSQEVYESSEDSTQEEIHRSNDTIEISNKFVESPSQRNLSNSSLKRKKNKLILSSSQSEMELEEDINDRSSIEIDE